MKKSNKTQTVDHNGLSKDSPQTPWKFRIWRFAIARLNKEGSPVIQWATGFVKLSNRIFWEHRIKKGDVVQIRKGWDNRYAYTFAVVDAVFLENLDLRSPQPHKDGTQMIVARNVPAGAVSRVGKCPILFKGTRRRNPKKMQEELKAIQDEIHRNDTIQEHIISALTAKPGLDTMDIFREVSNSLKDMTNPEFHKALNGLAADGTISLEKKGMKYRLTD